MIVYLDTSALVKVYVTEPFREPVVSAMQEAEAVASYRLAYVEAHVAFRPCAERREADRRAA